MEDHQFGKGLKMLRKSRKLTQQRLAEDSSLSRTYISIFERDKKMPTLTTLYALAVGFETGT